MDWLTGEPRLDDVLSDPVVHAVLRRDGIDPRLLRLFLEDIVRCRHARSVLALHGSAPEAARAA